MKKRSLTINPNPDYRFDNYVVGKSNKLVYEIAEQLSEKPGTKYNPIFIYGDSGTGKTHVLQAIAQRVGKEHSNIILRPAIRRAFFLIHMRNPFRFWWHSG